jgi:hypothetical protein
MAYYALRALYGRQDEWMAGLKDEHFNAQTYFLKNKAYQREYRKLETCKNQNKYIIQKNCDLINNVDLYVASEKITSIEILIGGQRIDKITGDIETIMNTNAAIFGSNRRVKHTDSHMIIPLHMAPFHDMNLVSPSYQYHELVIIIEGAAEVDFYAECYYVHLFDQKIAQEGVTYQNQSHYADQNVLKNGVNTFKLNFNHPMHCIYFWGFDKSKIKRVVLTLNDYSYYKPSQEGNTALTVYYNGDVELLEYYKESKNIKADPVFIFFSDMKFDKKPKATINFSKLDYPILTIETRDDFQGEQPFYLNGINIQGYKSSCGMFGLVFSK